jgi:hypothetical protein
MNVSAIIMELEALTRDVEAGLLHKEEVAQRLETAAEQLFRIAGRVRHGRGGL